MDDELTPSQDLKKTQISKSSWHLNVIDNDCNVPESSSSRRNSDPASSRLFAVTPPIATPPATPTRQRSASTRKDTMIAHVQAVLECFICLETMHPPIYQCVNGHNVCGSCRPKLQFCPTCRGLYADARNYALETLSEKMLSSPPITCEQCSTPIPTDEIDDHCCLTCPFKCSWRGLIDELWQHLEEEHPDDALVGSLHSFIHSEFNGEVTLRMIQAWDEVFAFYIRHDVFSDSIQALVQHIGMTEVSGNFMYKLEFFDDDHEESTLFRRKIRLMAEDIDECFESGRCICEPMKTVAGFLGDVGLKCTVEIYDSSLKGLASFSEA